MAPSAQNENGSQFSILLKYMAEFNGLHVAFGIVEKGEETLVKINKLGTSSGIPTGTVKIIDCGELINDQKIDMDLEFEFHRAVPLISHNRGEKCNTVSKLFSFKRKHMAHLNSQCYFYPLETTPEDLKSIAKEGDRVRFQIKSTGRRSMFVSEFYSYKCKYWSSNLVSKNYLSRGLNAQLCDDVMKSDEGKMKITAKRDGPSDESVNGREKEKRRGSTFGDERKHSSSKSCKFGGKRFTFSDDGLEIEWYKSDMDLNKRNSYDLYLCDLEFYSSD